VFLFSFIDSPEIEEFKKLFIIDGSLGDYMAIILNNNIIYLSNFYLKDKNSHLEIFY